MTRARPNRCVTLNVDTAARSGWAIWRDDRCICSDEVDVDDLEAVLEACRTAVELGLAHALPAVLVTEKAWGGNRHQLLGMGGAAKVWRSAWVMAGGQKSKRLEVYTSSWRARVLGKGMGRAPREVARPAEQRLAKALVGRDVGPDEAPAICIGKWTTYATEVWKVLPKRFQGAA